MEQVQRQPAHDGHILWFLPPAQMTGVFLKDHIQQPMHSILHAPMRLHGVPKGLRIAVQTHDVVAGSTVTGLPIACRSDRTIPIARNITCRSLVFWVLNGEVYPT